MTPEYLNQLADLADPDQLWRLPHAAMQALPADKRQQLDTGVALRRYAAHQNHLRKCLADGLSLIITPLTENGVASRACKTPPDHAQSRRYREGGAA